MFKSKKLLHIMDSLNVQLHHSILDYVKLFFDMNVEG